MKKFALGLSTTICLLALSVFALTALAENDGNAPSDARYFMHLSTDATDISCDLYTTVDASNALTGVAYACDNNATAFKRFTLDDLHKGIVFSKDETPITLSSRIDLATISGPDVDAVHGGDVNVHYISNGILGTYADYPFEVESGSNGWSAYTSNDNGHQRFDQIFMKKKTSFGQVIGVSCISVSLSPEQPGDC